MGRAFATVDRFIVFSEFERSLYADYFGVPLERFEMLHWGVAEPPVATVDVPTTNAICAVGSQARDYSTLLSAMRRLPHLRLILVATADSLRGLDLPPNVTVRLKIPLAEAQAVIRGSRFMVLPLVSSQVPCGHVTMVTAMYCAGHRGDGIERHRRLFDLRTKRPDRPPQRSRCPRRRDPKTLGRPNPGRQPRRERTPIRARQLRGVKNDQLRPRSHHPR